MDRFVITKTKRVIKNSEKCRQLITRIDGNDRYQQYEFEPPRLLPMELHQR